MERADSRGETAAKRIIPDDWSDAVIVNDSDLPHL